jgi:cyclase
MFSEADRMPSGRSKLRLIPVLLVDQKRLVKTRAFRDPVYLGDPINAVGIFNEKSVDELTLLDIGATREKRGPDIAHIQQIASEAFMPLAYGGGIRDVDDVERVIQCGIEKVILGTAFHRNKGIVARAARSVGSQSVVVSIDIRRKKGRAEVCYFNGRIATGMSPITVGRAAENEGAGELLLNDIDREGSLTSYDYDLIAELVAAVKVPVIANGGASSLSDLVLAHTAARASAAAAGSLFVFIGPLRGVLLSYPSEEDCDKEYLKACQTR